MHYRRHDVTGKLYKICMRWTQLELGFQNPFYTYKYSTCKDYVTSTIITDLWEYLSLCNASLIEHAPWTYTPPRTNDFFLNETVHNSTISSEHKQIFNEIRMSLKIITAADIVGIGSGSQILPNILLGINHRTSTLEWPNCLTFPPSWIST